MTDRLRQQIQFLTEIDKLKSVYRQTLITDKSRAETSAEHSWHIALMAYTLYEHAGIEGVCIDRVVKMLLAHDLVEIYAGDTFAYDTQGEQDKAVREQAAADRLFALLPEEQGSALRELWEEFDRMETPDAQYAAAIDRLQPLINNRQTNGHTWVKHHVSAEQIFQRMRPVETAIPALWPYVEAVVQEALAQGYTYNAAPQ